MNPLKSPPALLLLAGLFSIDAHAGAVSPDLHSGMRGGDDRAVRSSDGGASRPDEVDCMSNPERCVHKATWYQDRDNSMSPISTKKGVVVKPADVDSMPHKFLRGALRKIAEEEEEASEDVPQEYFSVNGTIWAEGTRRVPYNSLFVVKAPRDGSTCSRRIERRPHRFCPTFEGRPLQIERLELGAPEGNDGFATAEITDGGLCMTAYVTSIDDGRGTFGDCRGRSWLNRQEIRFFGFSRVPNSSSKQQRVDTIIDVGTDGNYSYSQQYAGQPQDFEDLIWKYNLNVTRFLNDELASSFSLSTNSPTSDTMISAIDGGLLSLTGD